MLKSEIDKIELIEEAELNEFNSSLYLLNSNNNLIEKIIDKNLPVIDESFNFNKYPVPQSVISQYIDSEMNGLEKIEHTCQNLVIIDPYLFKDNAGQNWAKKMPNLIKMLKLFGLHKSNLPSHFSAIVSYENDTNNIAKKIQAIKEELENSNFDISVFAIPKNSRFGPFLNSNRYFFTDFCFGEYQHIFDRIGSISASFYHEDINFNPKTMNSCITEIVKKYEKEPEKIGLVQQKFGKILDNPLFKNRY